MQQSNTLLRSCLLLLLLMLAFPAIGLAEATDLPAPPKDAVASSPAEIDGTANPAPKYLIRNTSVRWDVVSSGGTRATIGTDKYLFGTAVQTAVGVVSTPNYVIHQGFWQNFAKPCLGGDADGSGSVTISDAVYIINFIFAGGPTPATSCGGDADADGRVSVADAVAIVMQLFAP